MAPIGPAPTHRSALAPSVVPWSYTRQVAQLIVSRTTFARRISLSPLEQPGGERDIPHPLKARLASCVNRGLARRLPEGPQVPAKRSGKALPAGVAAVVIDGLFDTLILTARLSLNRCRHLPMPKFTQHGPDKPCQLSRHGYRHLTAMLAPLDQMSITPSQSLGGPIRQVQRPGRLAGSTFLHVDADPAAMTIVRRRLHQQSPHPAVARLGNRQPLVLAARAADRDGTIPR
jgi:hypothetical protein